jgi:selenocysteine-specific elongation factor
MSDAPLTLGTAGHIDHGKTSLIRALTGIDTDRLPQERARGISIELGYASFELPGGARVSVIDVPGHERYVRTMVAGATGIDMFLMAIAADDGVMPQTREHAAVLRALQVCKGVVAVTKADLADPELAILQAGELLPDTEVVAVSARSGAGLGELREALGRVAASTDSRASQDRETRLHIDRVFTIKGAGTVVTGTLWSGSVARGDALELLPGRRRARAREVHVHDLPVERAAAGQRVAVNLSGLSVSDVARGDVVVGPDSELREAYLLDAELEFGPGAPATGDRVQVHHGTREAPARLTWLGGRFWQVRLERPLIADGDDRIVVRRIAPPDTLGGGRVLDPRPRKHGPSRNLVSRLTRLADGGDEPTAVQPAVPIAAANGAVVLGRSARALEARLLAAGFQPPLDAELDANDLAALREAGLAVRVNRSLHYHPRTIDAVKRIVIETASEHGGAITIAQLRDRLGTSRKFAQALLEHLDSERVTIRRADEHVVRRAHDGG